MMLRYHDIDARDMKSMLPPEPDPQCVLPAIAGVAGRIMRLLQEDDVSTTQIAKLACSDPPLASQVLSVANSAVFGQQRQVTSVQHALMILGLNAVKGIIVSTAILNTSQSWLSQVWTHSLACATVAGAISRKTMCRPPEDAYTAGLLHDIGKVLWEIRYPRALAQIRDLIARRDLTMAEAEAQILSVTHAQIGRRMARGWGFPESLVEPIRYHHEPLRAGSARTLTYIVHLADCLVRAYGYTDGCTDLVGRVYPEALHAVGLTQGELEGIIGDLDRLLAGVRQLAGAA